MRASSAALALAVVALGCGETLVDHRAGKLIEPPSNGTSNGNGCDTVAACGPSCVTCTTSVAGAAPACVGSPGAEFCDYECVGGLLKCTGGCCEAATVVAGDAHTCAITFPLPGALYCWGSNASGQVAPNVASAVVTTPLEVRSSGVRAVALGAAHTCVIGAAGVECWGNNLDGEAPTTIDIPSPSSIAAGLAHSCALASGGAVTCWGSNTDGQRGGAATIATPIASGATEISLGAKHSCALVGGEVRCWGRNDEGQLGVAGPSSELPVAPLTGVAAVGAGANLTCAADAPPNDEVNGVSNALQCWGSGLPALLPADPQATPAIPLRQARDQSVVRFEVDALAAGRAHVCVQRAGEFVMCLGGENGWGQLGGLTPVGAFELVTVPETLGAKAFSAGIDHACAVLATRALRCWGRNSLGQLGDGTQLTPGVDDGGARSIGTPVPVSGL
jgi:hypothetical protein